MYNGGIGIICPTIRVDGCLALDGIVHQVESIISIVLFRQFRYNFSGHVRLDLYVCFSFLSAFGGNQDDTIGALHTIDSRSRGILQYGDAGYGRNVDRIHFTFYTIYQHERCAVVPRTLRTDDDFGVFFAWHTRRGGGDDARQVTGQGSTEAGHTGTFEYFAGGLGDRTYHTCLFLLAITYHHYLFQHFRVVFEGDGHGAVRLYFYFLRLHTDV